MRDARDQNFLLDVKQEYGPSLADLGNIHKFERIFGRTVQVDRGLQTESGVENLLGTLISSESLRVRQVQFQVNLTPVGANSCSCDTATPQQIAASVHSFLYGGDTVPRGSTAAEARAVRRRKVAGKLPLAPISTAALAQARGSATRMPFPVQYPRVQDAGGSGVPVSLRDYRIRGTDGRTYPAYVAVFSSGLLGQYYDVQGMTWTGAPMLNNPDQTVSVGGRTYYLYYSGQHLTVIAWSADRAMYWIHNSLTDAVGNGELLAIAEQTEPVRTPGRSGSAAGTTGASARVRLTAVVAPTRPGTATNLSLLETIGSIGGLLTLIAAPLMGVLLLRRRRQLSELRGQVHATLRLEAQLTAATAHATISIPSVAGPPPPEYTRYTSSIATTGALRRFNLRTRRVVGAAVATVAAIGVLAVLVTGTFDHSPTTGASDHPPSSSAPGIPTVPVAVLNATSTQGAAGRLAQQLRSRGVKIAAIGNLVQSRRPGLWILYAPGARTQAARLARMLNTRVPAIAPIDPAAQAAAGTATEVVAVIT